MAEQTPAREPRVTGDDILSEILRNMEEGLFKIRYTTLVPSIFRVYLHNEDYEPLRGAVPYLVVEAKRALNERLARWGATSRTAQLLKKFVAAGKGGMEYKILSNDWTIELYPDVEGKLQRGEIEIYSELGAAPKADYGVGSLTRRIMKGDADGQMTVRRDLPVYAHLRYEDRTGPHIYAVTKNQITVGRGGKAHWVDLKLDTLPDVSREHCRLRRDPETGRFHIKDLSQFGTTVNGSPVPGSLEIVNGEQRDQNREVPLPHRARIGLAGILFLDFEQVNPR